MQYPIQSNKHTHTHAYTYILYFVRSIHKWEYHSTATQLSYAILVFGEALAFIESLVNHKSETFNFKNHNYCKSTTCPLGYIYILCVLVNYHWWATTTQYFMIDFIRGQNKYQVYYIFGFLNFVLI